MDELQAHLQQLSDEYTKLQQGEKWVSPRTFAPSLPPAILGITREGQDTRDDFVLGERIGYFHFYGLCAHLLSRSRRGGSVQAKAREPKAGE